MNKKEILAYLEKELKDDIYYSTDSSKSGNNFLKSFFLSVDWDMDLYSG